MAAYNKEIENYGLIVDEDVNKFNQYFIATDEEGYKIKTCLNSLRNGYKGARISISNPFTIYNINLYCQKETNGQKLLEDNYINNKTLMKWACPIHGEYYQNWRKFYEGSQCKKCGFDNAQIHRRITQDDFVNRAKEMHGDKYDYSKTKYVTCKIKVEIYCNTCKELFIQTPRHHLNGVGCPNCAKEQIGWNKTSWVNAGNNSSHFDGFKLYIIECWSSNERFYKIGRTFTKIKNRFGRNSYMPYQWKLINSIEGSGEYIYDLENKLHRQFKKYKYNPKIEFSGDGECFNTEVKNLIKEVI